MEKNLVYEGENGEYIYYRRNNSEIVIEKVIEKAQDKYINYVATISSGGVHFLSFEEITTTKKYPVEVTKTIKQNINIDNLDIDYDTIKNFVESGEHIKSVVYNYLNEIINHLYHILKSHKEDA